MKRANIALLVALSALTFAHASWSSFDVIPLAMYNDYWDSGRDQVFERPIVDDFDIDAMGEILSLKLDQFSKRKKPEEKYTLEEIERDADKFVRLRAMRNELLREIPAVKDELAKLKRTYEIIERGFQEDQRIAAQDVDSDLEARRDRIEVQITKVTAAIERFEKESSQLTSVEPASKEKIEHIESVAEKLEDARKYKKDQEYQLSRINYEKKQMQYEVDNAIERVTKGKDILSKIAAFINGKAADLETLEDRLFHAEEKITEALTPESEKNEFKLAMSWAFAALVALVIVGFFIIAYKDARVRSEIFTGESGIQFITLFSLVIAIILFGITGILEDKSLAALLGGISGYILGRGTASEAVNRLRDQNDQSSSPAGSPPVAPAGTPPAQPTAGSLPAAQNRQEPQS